MKSKKGQVVDNLGNLVSGLAGIAILAAIIFLVIAESQDVIIKQNACTNTAAFFNETTASCVTSANHSIGLGGTSSAYNSSVELQSATSDIPGWLPIVVVAVIGGLLLTLVRIFRR